MKNVYGYMYAKFYGKFDSQDRVPLNGSVGGIKTLIDVEQVHGVMTLEEFADYVANMYKVKDGKVTLLSVNVMVTSK